MLQRHNHFNGLKTALLFGAIWGLLLLVGAGVAAYLGNSAIILVFGALVGMIGSGIAASRFLDV